MSSIIEIIEILTNRLPELEYYLNTTTKIRCVELPKGLFRSGQYREEIDSLTCIEEIRADLAYLKASLMSVSEQHSPAVLYLAKQMSLKMHMLLQLCQRERRKKKLPTQTTLEMKQLVTRQQWLDTVFQERTRLLAQQSALQLALERNQTTHSTPTLQHALSDVAGQLSSLQHMLSALTD